MVAVKGSTALPDKAFPTSPALAQLLPAEAVLDALKMMLIGASLNEVLTSVTRLIEAHREGMMCSILLLDEDGLHLRYGVAVNVTDAYRAATEGVCIGPTVGSCGAAAYLRQPVFISDMLSHPNWERFKDVIHESGLRAAWSTPIMSHDGKVLGTFCMYYREVRQPTPEDIQLIDYASRIAGLAIERERSQSALTLALEQIRKSEAQLKQIVDIIPQGVAVLDPDGKALYVNQWLLDYSGLSRDEILARDFRTNVFHPEDTDRVQDERRLALARGLPFENEQRALGKDGKYRWFLIRYNPLHDEQGRTLRWYATGTDIDDRKQVEERMRKENLALREEIDRSSMYEEIVGSSAALRSLISQVNKVAPTDSTVMIFGETGTGKELIASAIHKRSKRAARAFIRVNCAAIPPSLIASELFGHEKGAFTGALQRRAGRFESADGGTIFLDEIGELSLETQIALLRVLQEREFERIGSSQPIAIDVRVLAATNRDLEAAVAGGTFRQDLFYRLNVIPFVVPPLRERLRDIPTLANHFLNEFSVAYGKKIRELSDAAMDVLLRYPWPGNVRELRNLVERLVIVCPQAKIEPHHLPPELFRGAAESPQQPYNTLHEARSAYEREFILRKLQEHRWNMTQTATALGLERSHLYRKMKSLGIAAPE